MMSFFILEGLKEEEIKKVEGRLKTERFQKGTELYRTGSIGMIITGSAKIIRNTEAGASITVRKIGAGEMFGAASLFGEWDSSLSSILAMENGTIRYITETDFKELIQQYPQIALNYIAFLSDRIRFLNKRLDTFSAGSVDHKLYEYLLSIADEEGTASLDIGMAELARRLKIGRSSLYRCIDNLEEAGLVKREKNKFILK
ncbi:MAG: Crp/Fnr family transcriptional regulator [Lachnospiraceae bacterium]|nr:Crp/Fnr family transcriptional regulator [Lachnospiraceae bacterium]